MSPSLPLFRVPLIRKGSPLLLLSLGFVILLISSGAGCSSIKRCYVSDEDILASRRLTQQGIDAMHRGQLDDAERVFSDAMESSPLDQNTRLHYAELLWKQGDKGQAVIEMEEALRLSGGDKRMYVRLGQMYFERGQFEQALTQANRAIDARIDRAQAWALRGDIYHQQGNAEEALTSYYRSLSYEENQPPVQMAVATIHRQKNRPQRALSTLQHLADQYPSGREPVDCLFQQGLALTAMGRYQASTNILKRAASRDPGNPDIYFHLAHVQRLDGNLVDAQYAAQQALALNPEDPAIQTMVAQLEEFQQRMALQASP